MRDNVMFKWIKQTIETGLTAQGYVNTLVKQSFQPTQQGATLENVVLLNKILGDIRYGYVKVDDRWDEENQEMVHTESQWYESTFQVNALALQNPSDVNSVTASDLLNAVAGILQSETGMTFLRSKGIGVLRVREVRNPSFQDDRDRSEYSPSFDFTVTHENVIISTTPATETVEIGIYRI